MTTLSSEMLCSIDWVKVAKVFSALMTPVIASVAVLIAYQQYVINHRQHRLALLEKRMVVFDAVMDLIAQVIQAPRGVPLDSLFTLLRKTANTIFSLEQKLAHTSRTSIREDCDCIQTVQLGNL
jgi:hypothetical protein